MQLFKYVIPFFLVLCSAFVNAAQQVGGLNIDYAATFQENSAKARAWQVNMNPEMQGMVRGLQVFEAAAASGISDARIIKLLYNAQIRGDIDSAANEMVANIVRLPGIKNPTHTITQTKVSGKEGRRVSFESGRFDGRIGAEFLIIQDHRTQAIYQIQMIFGKRAGFNPLATTSLNDERALAKKVLDSVRVN